ncbi:hypothetical protein GUJ93_ZPchr0006g41070 [Zizania palustris]|uniref:DUF4187 domain-containing protein n=1 Tax=Zizania palustris TaxID=103762 RepID=A0A8J5SMX1_ZIZPA|nr:hypothetical protein GUJ93_ZPchr0006g41070 [Zizania palustris]
MLAQLENRETAVPLLEGEEKEKAEEEEEEVITEEDLQNILAKLRDEHDYCLSCGCKYESAEAWQMNALGLMKMIIDSLCQGLLYSIHYVRLISVMLQMQM